MWQLANLSGILVLVFAVKVVISWYFRRKYNYWTARNVPSLPTRSFIGSFLETTSITRHRTELYTDIYNQYRNDKIVGGFKGWIPELFIRDPDIIRMILLKDFNYFQDRSLPYSDYILFQNLFQIKGEKWRTLRQKLTPTFTSGKIKQMFPLMVECGQTLQKYVKDGIKKNQLQEVYEIMAKYTTDTIGSCVFGLNMQSMEDDDAPFRKIGKTISQPSKIKILIEVVLHILPGIIKILPNAALQLGPIEKFMVNLVKQLIQTRTLCPSNRHDFIDLMMELRKNDLSKKTDENDFELQWTDELITAQAFVFFLAGFETSSNLMTFALYELALNPNIQEKLRNEINSVLAKHNDQLTYDAVREMDYLDMVMDETLRKYPPLGFLNRESNAKYKIPGTDVTIDKDVHIIIPVLALHSDPQYFPQPAKFIPERFAVDAEKTYHPFSYLPFGDGPRNCIGLRFGKLQSAAGLVSFLRKYSVEKTEETPTKITTEPSSFISVPEQGVWLRVKSVKTKK